MNRETTTIREYILKSSYCLDRIDELRIRFNNIKDFQNQFNYLVMEILNEEKKFINLSRNKIDLPILCYEFFERNVK